MSTVRDFVSDTNKINEAVVVGTFLLLPFIVGYFLPVVTPEKFNTLAVLLGACFGIGGAKAILGNKRGL